MRILIERLDHIGDIIIALPLVQLLRRHLPSVHITFLQASYTLALQPYLKGVDQALDWGVLQKLPPEQAVARIRAEQFDAFLILTDEAYGLPALKLAQAAKIPIRICNFRFKRYRFRCTRWVQHSYGRSGSHMAENFMVLARRLGIKSFPSLAQLCQQTYLRAAPVPAWLTQQLASDAPNVILHPGSQGNGREWPMSSFLALAKRLAEAGMRVIFTGVAADQALLPAEEILHSNIRILFGQTSLVDLLALLVQARLLIAAGTGPLHMAAALGRACLGLYPDRKRVNAQTWRPLGPAAAVLTSGVVNCRQVCSNRDCACMRALSVDSVWQKVQDMLAVEQV
tara:strand:- start:2946 stop:3965 length:1020 start_codon:yes stop_codon:yes gene_type:complete